MPVSVVKCPHPDHNKYYEKKAGSGFFQEKRQKRVTQTIKISLAGGRLHCHRHGSGALVVLALHGFADDGLVFAPLFPALAASCTLYAVDLPFHGESEWRKPEFNREDILELAKWVRRESGAARLILMGYSMGGRLILSLLPRWREKLGGVILLAPDGLGTRGLQAPDLLPIRFRRGLGKLAHRPERLLRLATYLHERGVVSRFISAFLNHHLSSHRHRQRLIRSWVSLARFPVRLRVVRASIRKSGLPVAAYAGRRDPLVPPAKVHRCFQNLPTVHIFVCEADHLLITPTLGESIAGQLGTFNNPD